MISDEAPHKLEVMLIDDDKECLNAMSKALDYFGFTNHKFIDPSEALECYKTQKYDVIVTDYKMPSMSGIKLLEDIKSLNLDACVIITTGYADTDAAIEALNNGAYAFFTKPLDIQKLADTLVKIESERQRFLEVNRKIREFEKTQNDLEWTYNELQEHVVVVDQIQAISRKIYSVANLSAIMHEIVHSISHLLACDFCLVAFQDELNGHFNCYSNHNKIHSQLIANISSNPDSSQLSSWILKSNSELTNSPSDKSKCFFQQYGIDLYNYLRVPLIRRGKVLGTLAAFNKKGGFASNDRFLISAVSETAVMAIFNSRLISQLQQLFEKTVESLAKSIDARDHYTRGHTGRVAEYVKAIAETLGWRDEKIHEVYIGTLLHDIGKIGIPDAILNKTGRLTQEEYNQIKNHVNIGLEIIDDIPQLEDVIDCIHCHHERYDGRGYPNGLKGEEISIKGRIICIADSFDAMTSNRSYRKALSVEEAVAELQRNSGSQFDPYITEVFLSILNDRYSEKIPGILTGL